MIITMLPFKELIARADSQLLDSFLPQGAGLVIRAIDPTLMYPARLQRLLLSQASPQSLLLNKIHRTVLIDLLPGIHAKQLSEIFGYKSNSETYGFLKSLSLSSISDKKAFLSFFGLEFQEEVEEKKPAIVNANGQYSLFDHQINALKNVRDCLNKDGGRVLLHMPTGSGKTRTAVNFASEYLRQEKNRVVVWLANSEELCDQAFEEFVKAWGNLGNREISCLKFWGSNKVDLKTLKDGFVVIGLAKAFASIVSTDQGLGYLSAKNPLVIFDEAHQVIAPTYKLITDLLIGSYSKAKLLGLSATPGKTWNDPEKDEELVNYFNKNKVVLNVDGYPNPVSYLIDEGYLAKPTFRKIMTSHNMGLTNEDFDSIQKSLDLPKAVLEKLGEDQTRNLMIVQQAEKLLGNHKRVILFASSVRQSDLLASVLGARGKNARSITSSTSDFDRKQAIESFKDNSDESKILCNFGILTTGFDAPKTSAALIARPTLSLVLYSQMVGRALRGKKAGGNASAEILTVIDEGLEQFNSIEAAFSNWEDVWQ